MEARRSVGHSRRHSIGSNRGGDREGLIRAYDEEEAAGFGLTDLAEESDEDNADPRSPMMGSHAQGVRANGSANGNRTHLGAKGLNETVELQSLKSGDK